MRPRVKIALWIGGVLLALLFLRRNMAYLTSTYYLSGLILLEIVLASLWHFQVVFFPMLMLVFLWAGSDPGLGAYTAMSVRWVVLGVGAPVGAFLWMRKRQRPFTALHLAGLFCVAAALASAMMSNLPLIALMKVGSLLLLFLYAATGARLALVGREKTFMRGLLLGCEGLVGACALGSFAGLAVLGNPNSMGAVMAVAVAPFLLWGFVIAETQAEKYRKGAFLLVCGILLYSSLSRASLLAAAIGAVILCVSLRRERLLVRGAFLCILLLAFAAVLRPSQFSELVEAKTSDLVYKGKREGGLLGSRRSPWENSLAVIKEHPWLGSGFGTSDVRGLRSEMTLDLREGIYTGDGALREHGNSYLAILEYMGLAGIVPFVLLLFLVVRMILQMCLWMRRTGNAYHPAIPMTMVLVAGLVHAFFEDWLFAVGYHLCVLFWTMAFLLKDILPVNAEEGVRGISPVYARSLHPLADPVVTHR